MSSILATLKRLWTRLSRDAIATPDPETMSLHDWADLPAYHPRADRAPC